MVKKNNWKAWLYLAPVIILMAVFTFYPLINTIGISFLKNYNYLTATSDGFTFDNYGYVLGIVPKVYTSGGQTFYLYFTDVIQKALPNTLFITFVTVPISVLISLLISVGLNSIKWFKKFLQTIFFVPYVTNAIAVGMVFGVIFADKGLWNYIFQLGQQHWIDASKDGLPSDWGHAMFALCFYIIWHSLPFKILIFLSGLQNIDKQYYDAAKIDSAGRVKTFWKITVPLLSPQILYVMITSFIAAFKEYNSVIGLFGADNAGWYTGSHDLYTIVYYVYDCISDGNVQLGAAAAVMLFIIIMLFTAIQFWVSKKRVHY
jgi:multiple sugar transport system permease protein